ncbi:hypothetical protein [Pseudodesulfovibrio karagichevae]|uniref:Uncharacterized protein n=1 Tax=Pseudodesulfovibrio karagichevae TaxID=3239305 RepID=A0ABV4K7F5_9BACT
MFTRKYHLTTFDTRDAAIAALKEFAPYREHLSTFSDHTWFEICLRPGTTLWLLLLSRQTESLLLEKESSVIHMLTYAFLDASTALASTVKQRNKMLHALECVQAHTMLPWKQGRVLMKRLGYEPKDERGHSSRWEKGVVANALGEKHRQPCERWKTDDCPDGIVEGDCDRCPRLYYS